LQSSIQGQGGLVIESLARGRRGRTPFATILQNAFDSSAARVERAAEESRDEGSVVRLDVRTPSLLMRISAFLRARVSTPFISSMRGVVDRVVRQARGDTVNDVAQKALRELRKLAADAEFEVFIEEHGTDFIISRRADGAIATN
jgi:hypothetical protein